MNHILRLLNNFILLSRLFHLLLCVRMYVCMVETCPTICNHSPARFYFILLLRILREKKAIWDWNTHFFFLEFDQMKKVSFRIEVFSLVFSFQQWKMTFFLFQKCSHFDGKLLITLWSSNLSFQFYHQKSNWNGSRLLKFIDDRRTDAIKIEIRKKSRENLLRLSS